MKNKPRLFEIEDMVNRRGKYFVFKDVGRTHNPFVSGHYKEKRAIEKGELPLTNLRFARGFRTS